MYYDTFFVYLVVNSMLNEYSFSHLCNSLSGCTAVLFGFEFSMQSNYLLFTISRNIIRKFKERVRYFIGINHYHIKNFSVSTKYLNIKYSPIIQCIQLLNSFASEFVPPSGNYSHFNKSAINK